MTYFFPFQLECKKKPSCQTVFRMISSAPDLKHILQKLNILGQRQIIQPVPVVSDCLGHFVPINMVTSTQATSLAIPLLRLSAIFLPEVSELLTQHENGKLTESTTWLQHSGWSCPYSCDHQLLQPVQKT